MHWFCVPQKRLLVALKYLFGGLTWSQTPKKVMQPCKKPMHLVKKPMKQLEKP